MTSITASTTSIPTHDDLIAAAVRIRPKLIEEQAATERRTFFSEEIHEYFRENGLYRMLVPREYGGYEVDIPTFFKVGVEIARGCMSTGWCFLLSANHALQTASWFPASTQDVVFAADDFRAASMYAPTVTATPVDGGYELNGKVSYCSGIPYSTYFLGQARLPGTRADGSPRVAAYVAPKGSWNRLDDWGDTLGLKGSGSHSIVFEHAFLPADHLLEDVDLNDKITPFGTAPHGNPLYSGRALCIFTMSLASVTIGGGYNALDEYANQMRTRTGSMPPFVSRLQDPDYQRWYGAAATRLQLAEAALMDTARQHMELARLHAEGAREYTMADDLRLAGIARELMVIVWEAVELNLHRSIGASAQRNGERFERAFRDLGQAIGHRNPQLRDFGYRTLAQFELGLGLGTA